MFYTILHLSDAVHSFKNFVIPYYANILIHFNILCYLLYQLELHHNTVMV